ncbi:MAG: ribonuclease J [Proteobacteria bacterium]|nr:ribonuclease J [Pseudomonadota bacterium]
MGDRSIIVEPIGGVGEMGHHHLALDLGPDSFLFDCGALFPGPDDPGIDRICPPFDAASRRWNEGRLRALILTHGHLDHIGSVADLMQALPELSVYGTAFTLALLRRQLRERQLSQAMLRGVVQGESVPIGEATLIWHRVTHSLPSCSSVSVESPHGTVVHSGDFRIQDDPLMGEPTDLAGLAALRERGVDLALVDSTGAGSPGRTLPERDVVDNLAEALERVSGLAVITSFGSHVERIVACVHAARKVGRRVGIYGRSMQSTFKEAVDLGLVPLKNEDVTNVDVVMAGPRSEGVLVVTGTQGEWRAPLARIARSEDPNVTLGPGDWVGWSARVIPGNERAVGLVADRLIRLGVDVQPPWGGGPKLHTSGHGARDELAQWVQTVGPRYVLPVHGQQWHLWRHRDLLKTAGLTSDQVLQAESGQTLTLRPESGEVDVVDPIHKPEAVFVAGPMRWKASDVSLRARRKLARTGGATAILPWSAGLAGTPHVVTQGVFVAAEQAAMEREVGVALQAALSGRLTTASEAEIVEEGRIALRQVLKRRTGTKVECRVRIWRMVENVEV